MDTRAAQIPVHSDEAFDRWFWGDRTIQRPGDGQVSPLPALQAKASPDLSPGHLIDHSFIDFDHPPSLAGENAGWYRRRAEDMGDLAAELIAEGLDGTAYGQAVRAAHYGRIALELYEQRRREWIVTRHPSNFL